VEGRVSYTLIDVETDEVLARVFADGGSALYLPKERELIYFSDMRNPWRVMSVVHFVSRTTKLSHGASVQVYIRHMGDVETAYEPAFSEREKVNEVTKATSD